MAKEQKYSNSRPIFREVFTDQSSVIRNGGTPVLTTFTDGTAKFPVSNSGINYGVKHKLIGTDFSIRLRLNVLGATGSNRYFISRYDASTANRSWSIAYDNNNTLVFRYSSNGTTIQNIITASTTSLLGSFNEIVFTRAGNVGTFYINGVSFYSAALTATFFNSPTARFYVGGADNSSFAYSNSDIKLAEVYDRALSPSEIKNMASDIVDKEVVADGDLLGNLVTNGTFTTWAGTFPNELPTGWAAFGTHTADHYVTQSPTGACRIVSIDNIGSGINQTILTVGKKYRLSFDLLALSGTMEITGLVNSVFTTATITTGTKYFDTVATSTILTFKRGSTCDYTIDNVTVQEIQPSTLLDFNSTQGILEDRTGLRTLTATDVTIQKQGALFNGTTSLINTGSDFIGTKAVTVCGWYDARGLGESDNGRIIDNGVLRLFISGAAAKALSFTSNNSTTISSADNTVKFCCKTFFSLTRTSTGIVNFYIGNTISSPALSGSANQASGTPAVGTTNVIIGNRLAADRTFDGLIPMLKIYEGILTLEDITSIWQETRKHIK